MFDMTGSDVLFWAFGKASISYQLLNSYKVNDFLLENFRHHNRMPILTEVERRNAIIT
jgi:hypothetical protein